MHIKYVIIWWFNTSLTYSPIDDYIFWEDNFLYHVMFKVNYEVSIYILFAENENTELVVYL